MPVAEPSVNEKPPPANKLYDDWTVGAEWPNEYGPGLFCPIYLGDTLNNRYHIYRKLGYGSQSTVWLAKDEQTSQHVAVKVISAEWKDELVKLTRTGNAAERYVEQALDQFVHHSANGSHMCLVLEPLGRSLHAVFDRAWDYSLNTQLEDPNKYDAHSWSFQIGRRICHQILLGLDYLHSQKIAHLDLQPGNIAFALNWDISASSANELQDEVWNAIPPSNIPEADQAAYEDNKLDPHVASAEHQITESQALPAEETMEVVPSAPKELGSIDTGAEDDDGEDEEHDGETTDSDSEPSVTSSDLYREALAYVRDKARAAREADLAALPDGDITASPHTTAWNDANLKRTATAQGTKFIKRLDGKPLQPTEIKYTLKPNPVHDRIIWDLVEKRGTQFRVVIIDLGFACSFEECSNRKLLQNANYRTPEYVLELPPTWQTDIFQFGMVLWSIVMDRTLIQWQRARDPRYPGSTYLRDLVQKIGPMPEYMRKEWPETADFLDADGGLLKDNVGIDGYVLDPAEHAYGDYRHAANRDRPKDMKDDDIDCLIDLMMKILHWEPEKRPSTAEILKHDFWAGL